MNSNILNVREHWQKVLIRVNTILGILISVTEVAVFIILYRGDLIEQELSVYLRDYLFIPSILVWMSNFGLYSINSYIRKKLDDTDAVLSKKQIKDYNSILNFTIMAVLTILCFMTGYVHYVFNVTLVLMLIPVLVSVVFYSVSLTRLLFVMNEVAVLIIALHRYIMRGGKDSFFVPDVLIAMVIVGAVSYISQVLIKHMDVQNKKLLRAIDDANVANRAKSDFLARMSHEIRTPINAVVGMDEMIIRESTESEIVGYAYDIKGAANTLLCIINDVLDISKIESGKMEIIPAEYETVSMIREVQNTVSLKAAEKGLKLVLDIDEKLPAKMIGDDVRLRQIIVNILNNAIKYTHIGVVTFKVSGEHRDNRFYLNVSVKDTGIGIKEEDLPKIREKFQRVDEENNRNIEGTGLGISIILELLDLMGSSLNIDSEYGKGSEFYFSVEQKIADATEIGVYDSKHLKVDSSEKTEIVNEWTAPDAKILVVDDSDLNLKVFCALLKKKKMQIDAVKSGKEAIEKVKENKYDIIFMDHMMPEMDGVEAMEVMKNLDDNLSKDTPVIVLTANAIVGAREDYLKMGFYDYLSKPIVSAKLDQMIKDIISI